MFYRISLSLLVSVPELRTLLSAALERVNLDLVFGADPTEDAGNGGHTHTASYLLLWLILIEIMSHCGPEVRAHVHCSGSQVPLPEFLLVGEGGVSGGGGVGKGGKFRNLHLQVVVHCCPPHFLVVDSPLPLTIYF